MGHSPLIRLHLTKTVDWPHDLYSAWFRLDAITSITPIITSVRVAGAEIICAGKHFMVQEGVKEVMKVIQEAFDEIEKGSA